ncbi:MAG: SAM-dependent methyltransferase, partial [Flammeovirgaceae bacterium]
MKAFQAKSFLRHWLLRVDEHSLHSPFFYDLYQQVINPKANNNSFAPIEELRKKLHEDHTPISVVDLGAASHHFSDKKRTIAQVARTSVTPPRWCQFVHRLIQHLGSKHVVELGTSMGIMSLCMANESDVQLTTFEGNTDMVNIALTNFEYFEKHNIQLVEGNLDKTLKDYLE